MKLIYGAVNRVGQIVLKGSKRSSVAARPLFVRAWRVSRGSQARGIVRDASVSDNLNIVAGGIFSPFNLNSARSLDHH